MKNKWYIVHGKLYMLCCLVALLMASCSTEDDEKAKTEEWGGRNIMYFEQIYQQAAAKSKTDPEHWKIIKTYSKDKLPSMNHSDYIVMQVLSTEGNTHSPEFTDSVRVHYRGFLMPDTYVTVKYGQLVGSGFDSSFYGDTLNEATAVPRKFAVSGVVEGFSTALMHMHPGDHCLITIPFVLGYSVYANGMIPACSTLVFDVYLHSFTKKGVPFPKFQ